VIRLYVVVEGQTEEFFGNVLAEVLWGSNVHPTPILLGTPGHKGGRTSYARVKRDVLVLLKQDRAAYCSTMIDLYGLGPGFPGHPPPDRLSNIAKVRHVEQAVKEDICEEIPDLRADRRFIPYLQLHEYEAILFSDPAAFAAGINHPNLQREFQRIRDEFESPEDINNNPETAPSKRVLAACRNYRKVIEGTQAAAAVGIPIMREECRHFREWIELLESLTGE
jgi:Domain of unknown function (DUF4276)